MTDQETTLLPGPAKLPHRARIAAGAANFTHAFCNTPQCSPARSSLLTGLEPHHTGVRTNVDGSSLGSMLGAKVPNIGSVFRAAGWATGYFGKWHLTPGGKKLDEFGFTDRAAGNDSEVAAAAFPTIFPPIERHSGSTELNADSNCMSKGLISLDLSIVLPGKVSQDCFFRQPNLRSNRFL